MHQCRRSHELSTISTTTRELFVFTHQSTTLPTSLILLKHQLGGRGSVSNTSVCSSLSVSVTVCIKVPRITTITESRYFCFVFIKACGQCSVSSFPCFSCSRLQNNQNLQIFTFGRRFILICVFSQKPFTHLTNISLRNVALVEELMLQTVEKKQMSKNCLNKITPIFRDSDCVRKVRESGVGINPTFPFNRPTEGPHNHNYINDDNHNNHKIDDNYKNLTTKTTIKSP